MTDTNTAPPAAGSDAPRRSGCRRNVLGCGLLLIILAGVALLGPRVRLDETVRPVELPAIEKLDAWLAEREATDTHIIEGAEAKIVWAANAPVRTPLSIVYFHGFTACRQELSPVIETLAALDGSNVYFPRLTAHGRTMPESDTGFATVTGNDWINDAVEALAIGRAIGQRVLLIGTSTGALYPLWLALRGDPEAAKDIAGMVVMSPNFGPADSRAEMLLWPWGTQIARVVSGTHHTYRTVSDDHAKYWTWRYPVEALPQMMSVVQMARELPLADLKVPTLVLYTSNDGICNPDLMVKYCSAIPAEVGTVENVADAGAEHHVLGGRILSEVTSLVLMDRIRRFIQERIGSGG